MEVRHGFGPGSADHGQVCFLMMITQFNDGTHADKKAHRLQWVRFSQ